MIKFDLEIKSKDRAAYDKLCKGIDELVREISHENSGLIYETHATFNPHK